MWFLKPAHLLCPRNHPPLGPQHPGGDQGEGLSAQLLTWGRQENMGSKPEGLRFKVPVWYFLASGTDALIPQGL